jgi:hypothetical protein
MSHDEHPNDSTLTQELRDSLSELAVPGRPPLAAITSRGRGRQRRRLAGLAGLGTCAAAGIALVLGLTGVFGAAPARTGTIQTAAFTLTSYTDGTVALRLGQLFDPAALQRAFAHDGIRAMVTAGTYCSSSPAVSNPVIGGALPGSATPPHSAPHGVQSILLSANFPVKPSQLAPSVDPVTVVINPAVMPSGTELYVGFFDLGHTVFADLIYTGSHTCRSSQDPPGVPWR